MSILAVSLVISETVAKTFVSDPFFAVEFYSFRVALLILFIVGLYRLVKREITK